MAKKRAKIIDQLEEEIALHAEVLELYFEQEPPCFQPMYCECRWHRAKRLLEPEAFRG